MDSVTKAEHLFIIDPEEDEHEQKGCQQHSIASFKPGFRVGEEDLEMSLMCILWLRRAEPRLAAVAVGQAKGNTSNATICSARILDLATK